MLPSALLDLVSLRLSPRPAANFAVARARGHIRRITQQDVRAPDEVPTMPTRPSGISTRDRYPLKARHPQDQVTALTELEARVAALKEAADGSIQAAQAKEDGPYFSEPTLQDIYKDLLAYPEPSPPQEQSSTDVVAVSAVNIVRVLRERLPQLEAAAQGQTNNPEGLATRLQARLPRSSPDPPPVDFEINNSVEINDFTFKLESASLLRELIGRLEVIVETYRTRWLRVEHENASPEVRPAPFALLTNVEWHALTEACLHADDADAAAGVLRLMKDVGLTPSDEQCDMVLSAFADRGLVERVDAYVAGLALDTPRERHRDLLIKARIKAERIDEACALLHTYETRTCPAPVKSYTRVIQALLQRQGPGSAQNVAQAWDLFAHMRYVAHPVPDGFLYSTMIRAASEPERALDLFTEMTVEQRIIPDTHAYTAVIRACARSKKFALDAFRIAREMFNSHRNALGEIPVDLRPDVHTFLALLEAAKHLGHLSRARWVLTEMARGARDVDADGGQRIYIDERALTHMFHTYAAYRPPFRREAVPLVHQQAPPDDHPDPREDAPSQARAVRPAQPLGFRGMPQSRGDVIREVTSLWKRVLQDRESPQDGSRASHPVFGRVRLTARLLNAYFAVHYVHSLPSEAYKVYDALFEPLGVARDAFSYVLALEAYTHKHLPPGESEVALSAARSVWKEWMRFEQRESFEAGLIDAGLVGRAWSAMIRLLTLTDNIDEAEGLLRRFVERYPPEAVKQPSPADPQRSNRTRLYAERPLVRLMEPSAVPEDRITPFLTFTDIALLHDRAIATRRMGLVHYMKWAMSAYEGALRRRREAQLRSI